VNQIKAREGLADIAEQIARGLAKASLMDGRAFIRTSVLFPSGATVVAVVDVEGGGRYRVSDLGQGVDEADILGIAHAYGNQAADIAARSGIMFDDRAFVVTRLEQDQLVGAVMAVANAAARALERAMLRSESRRQEAAVARLVGRLQRLFHNGAVTAGAELRGASTHPWRVDVQVRRGDDQAVFDLVTPHPASVAFTTTKFHDIALLERPPARIAVVHHKAGMGDFLAVLSQAAQVVEDDAPDRALTRAAQFRRAA
jgi:hypothetical protein